LGQEPGKRYTVRDWLGEWLQAKRGTVSPNTLDAYRQAALAFETFLGAAASARRLDSITAPDIERFLASLREQGLSPATINNTRSRLRIPFERAVKLGLLRSNPVAASSHEKADSAGPKGTFSGEQIAAILKIAPPDWQGAILFAYGCGSRLGDTINLRWSSLDVLNGVSAFVEQKTRNRSVVALHPDFLDWLSTQPVPADSNALVFPSLCNRPLNAVSAEFIGLVDRAGIEKRLKRSANAGKGRAVRSLTFHSLRHGAASLAYNAAAAKEIARRVTNHAPGGSLDTYLHEDLEAIRAAVSLIPRLPK
jgi:integrase